jgi:hypothetical protein
MALIADLCPNCQRVTRCHVVERGSVIGGLVFGIPFVLPSSSVSCCCGECGCEFKSQTWDHQKALSPGEAMSLDIEAILSLTNPALKEQLALPRLKAVPELGGAFHLLEKLKPGNLRTALKHALPCTRFPCRPAPAARGFHSRRRSPCRGGIRAEFLRRKCRRFIGRQRTRRRARVNVRGQSRRLLRVGIQCAHHCSALGTCAVYTSNFRSHA